MGSTVTEVSQLAAVRRAAKPGPEAPHGAVTRNAGTKDLRRSWTCDNLAASMLRV